MWGILCFFVETEMTLCLYFWICSCDCWRESRWTLLILRDKRQSLTFTHSWHFMSGDRNWSPQCEGKLWTVWIKQHATAQAAYIRWILAFISSRLCCSLLRFTCCWWLRAHLLLPVYFWTGPPPPFSSSLCSSGPLVSSLHLSVHQFVFKIMLLSPFSLPV